MAEKMAIKLRRGLVNSSMAAKVPREDTDRSAASALEAMLLLAEVRMVLSLAKRMDCPKRNLLK